MSYILGWVPSDQSHPIVVVVNPNSRKNRRIGDRADRLRAAGGDVVDVVETANLVDLSRVLAPRLRDGVRYLVADGGDGAFHWTLNETLRQLGPDRLPIMVPTRAGTIDFVAHKAGIRGRSEGIVRRLAQHVAEGSAPPTVRLDSVRLTDDDVFDRVGFAIAIGGVGQRFFDKYYEHGRSVAAHDREHRVAHRRLVRRQGERSRR